MIGNYRSELAGVLPASPLAQRFGASYRYGTYLFAPEALQPQYVHVSNKPSDHNMLITDPPVLLQQTQPGPQFPPIFRIQSLPIALPNLGLG